MAEGRPRQYRTTLITLLGIAPPPVQSCSYVGQRQAVCLGANKSPPWFRTKRAPGHGSSLAQSCYQAERGRSRSERSRRLCSEPDGLLLWQNCKISSCPRCLQIPAPRAASEPESFVRAPGVRSPQVNKLSRPVTCICEDPAPSQRAEECPGRPERVSRCVQPRDSFWHRAPTDGCSGKPAATSSSCSASVAVLVFKHTPHHCEDLCLRTIFLIKLITGFNYR